MPGPLAAVPTRGRPAGARGWITLVPGGPKSKSANSRPARMSRSQTAYAKLMIAASKTDESPTRVCGSRLSLNSKRACYVVGWGKRKERRRASRALNVFSGSIFRQRLRASVGLARNA